MESSEPIWYLLRDDKQYGPYPFHELLRQAELGAVRPEDLFWRPGFTEWTPASSIPELLQSPEANSPVPANQAPSLYEDIAGVIAKGVQSSDGSREVSIRHLNFDLLKALKSHIAGWRYPARNVSAFLPLFTAPQRAAITFYGLVAIATAIAGVALAILMGGWWWFALLLLTPVIWRANRRSMEQFFVENLQNDPAFFECS